MLVFLFLLLVIQLKTLVEWCCRLLGAPFCCGNIDAAASSFRFLRGKEPRMLRTMTFAKSFPVTVLPKTYPHSMNSRPQTEI